MYVPATAVFTVLFVTIFAVISPSTLSVAVAPGSVYVAPWFTATGLWTVIVITGASVSTASLTKRTENPFFL